MDMRVIEVTDFKSEVRFDLRQFREQYWKLPLQVMRGSPLVLLQAKLVSSKSVQQLNAEREEMIAREVAKIQGWQIGTPQCTHGIMM